MAYIQKRRISRKTDKKDVSQRRNAKWLKYYGDKRWKLLRNWYIQLHPLCEECLFNGRSVPAEHVHHRIPFGSGTTEEERFRLLLDINNLESVCQECHQKIHNELKHKDQN